MRVPRRLKMRRGVCRLRTAISLVANEVEHGETVAVRDDCFAVDQERPRWQCRDCRNNDWKATGEVIAVASDEPDTGAIEPGHDAKAIVLDFVNPAGARRRDLRWRRQAWFDNFQTGADTLTQRHGRLIRSQAQSCERDSVNYCH